MNDLQRCGKSRDYFAQLRTGMTPMDRYLHNTKAVEKNFCEHDKAVESREHFILRCAMWSEQQEVLGAWTAEEDLSRLLEGKAFTCIDDCTPDMDAVRAVVQFALATKQSERDTTARGRMS